VQFAGARLLYDKVAQQWHTLDEEKRRSLPKLVTEVLSRGCSRASLCSIAVQKLASVLAAISVRLLAGLVDSGSRDAFKRMLFEWGKSGAVDDGFLATLRELPYEFGLMKVSGNAEQQLRAELKTIVVPALRYAANVLGADNASASVVRKREALHCVRAWMEFGVPGKTMGHMSQFFLSMFRFLRFDETRDAAVDVLVASMSRKIRHVPTINAYLAGVVALRGEFARARRELDEVSVCIGICRLASCFGEHFAPALANGDLARQSSDALATLLLECTFHPERDVSSMAFHYWRLMADAIGDSSRRRTRASSSSSSSSSNGFDDEFDDDDDDEFDDDAMSEEARMLSDLASRDQNVKRRFASHFSKLLERAVAQCRYAKSLAALGSLPWDGVQLARLLEKHRDDDWAQYREYAVEAFEACFDFMGARAFLSQLGHMWKASAQSGSWLGFEAIMYAVLAVSPRVSRAREADAHALLGQLLKLALKLPQHPIVTRTAMRLLGACAQWLSRADKASLDAVMTFLFGAIGKRVLALHACTALKDIAKECAAQLANRLEFMVRLAQQKILAQLASFSDALDAKVQLFSALMIVAKAAPHAQVMATIEWITKLVVASLQRVMSGGGGDDQAMSMSMSSSSTTGRIHSSLMAAVEQNKVESQLVGELDLLTNVYRHLTHFHADGDGDAPAPSPVMASLASVWPHLQTIAKRWRDSDEVVEALCRLYKAVFLSARDRTARIVVPIVNSMLAFFDELALPDCIDVIEAAIAAFRRSDDASSKNWSKVVAKLSSMVFASLAIDMHSQVDVMHAYLSMLTTLLGAAPRSFPIGQLDVVLKLCTAAIHLPTPAADAAVEHCATDEQQLMLARRAVQFLHALALLDDGSPSGGGGDGSEQARLSAALLQRFDALMAQRGGLVVRALLETLVMPVDIQRQTNRLFARFLLALCARYAPLMERCMPHVIANLASKLRPGTLTESHRRALASLLVLVDPSDQQTRRYPTILHQMHLLYNGRLKPIDFFSQ
jgi:hypothetical protein